MNEIDNDIKLILDKLEELNNPFVLRTQEARYIINCLKTETNNMYNLTKIKELK